MLIKLRYLKLDKALIFPRNKRVTILRFEYSNTQKWRRVSRENIAGTKIYNPDCRRLISFPAIRLLQSVEECFSYPFIRENIELSMDQLKEKGW